MLTTMNSYWKHIFAIGVLFLSGCTFSETPSIAETNTFTYEDVSKDLYCLEPILEDKENRSFKEIVVYEENEYKNLLNEADQDRPSSGCKNFIAPEFNFDEGFLLGQMIFGYGCSFTHYAEAVFDPYQSQITFTTYSNSEGDCEAVYEEGSFMWITGISEPLEIIFDEKSY